MVDSSLRGVIRLLTLLLAGAVAAVAWVFADGPRVTPSVRVDALGTSATIGLGIDRVSVLLLLLVVFLALVAAGFGERQLDLVPARRFAARLLGCVAALAVTVTAPSLPVLAVGWTASALAVVALVDVAGTPASRSAAGLVRRRLLVGDAFLWAGLVAAAAVFTDLDRAAVGRVVADASDGAVLVVAALLVVAGAARSALVPFHRWLPETTAAPTPVSAQLHGGFVNGLGVLGVLWWPLFAASAPARVGLIAVGVVTALVTTAQMRARADIKGRLVSSTSAQMGYMAIELGVGVPGAALLHLLGHGCYKATLFLGSGSAVRPGARAHAHRTPGPVAWAFAALLALALVSAAAALGFPASGLAAVVLLGAAWVTVTAALAPVLGSDRTAGHPAVLTVGVLALAALALALIAGFEDVVAASLEPGVTWSTGVAITLGALIVGAALLGVVLDRAARRGGLPRLHAWARRAALPPRLDRPGLGSSVEPLSRPTAPVSPGERAETRARVEEAARVVAPTYPLTAFVASNPLARLESLPVEEALRRVGAARGDLDLTGFGPLHGEEPCTDAALRAVLGERFALLPVLRAHENTDPRSDARPEVPDPVMVDAARVALARVRPEPPGVATVGELVDRACGTAVIDRTTNETALWCAAWADAEISAWPLPAGAGLWAAWRAAALPGSDRALGAPGFAAAVAALPARADEAVAVLLDAMAIPAADQVDVLARSLGRLPGWAAHLGWRVAQRHDDGAQPAELLAVLLAYEALLADAVARRWLGCPGQLPAVRGALGARGIDAAADARSAAALDLAVGAAALGIDADHLAAGGVEGDARIEELLAFDAVARAMVWARAAEERDRTPLLHSVVAQAGTPTRPRTRAEVQVVCCIDVRSERLRRNLEATGGVETFGFAGFFGVPFHYVPAGASDGIDQCPVLVSPRNTVGESAAAGADRALAAVLGRRADGATIRGSGHAVETEPLAPFALAESLGAFMAVGAAARTFAPATATALLPGRSDAAPSRVDLDGTAGFTLDERTYLAEAALRTFGLTRDFAPLVLLCGHDASTVNNPYGTAYRCGACGGQGGAPNARVLAAIANDDAVRARLAERGIPIPADTRFVAALHDTTLDRVTIIDRDAVPDAWSDVLATTERRLAVATEATAHERWIRRPGLERVPRDGRAALRAAARRSADWAQVRPEWGLAGNLAFVAAPRTLTAPLDLDGRVFLHSYEWEHDREGAALEVILTAPLVVAEWINTQYWCSAAAPEAFGAGDKALHNVVGGFGVLTGPRGDLRVGLPRQGVFAADGTRVHQPRRLLAVVRAPRALVDAIVQRTPVLTQFVDHGWLDLATLDPETGVLERRTTAGGWEAWAAGAAGGEDVPTAPLLTEVPT